MAEAAQGADRAGAARAPIHDRGVQLDVAEHVGQPARPHAVVGEVVLHDLGRLDHRVERRAAPAQDAHADGQPDRAVARRDHHERLNRAPTSP
jgi:hypothetical protein